ncbi:MAG TPA: pilus assembly protein TadG-related protein [Acidimicrobiales bacterium]|nr:pilus assembly protein TadG-related protein [Acidimicrobiales bacterium]
MRLAASRRSERGFVIPLLALSMVVLLIFCGFAVDVGGWYARAAKIQRAADAAALAGVVWMPDFTSATAAATTAATRNGFTTGGNITVTVSAVPGNSHQLRVSITDSKVDQYFSKLAINNESITRTSVAEYVLPVPLGSPDNTLGNQSNSDSKNLWASISGPYTDKSNGDPYSTKCTNGSSGSNCSQTNNEDRDTGYLYSIDVPAAGVGQNLTVQVWDAGNYARANYANVEDADNGSVNTEFELFKPSGTPLDSSTYTDSGYSLNGKCTSGAGRWIIADGASESTYENKFATLCTVNVPVAGIYHLQVKSRSIPGISDSGNGWNQFSLKATLTGTTQPALYGYGDLSLFNNLQGQSGNLTATFYLARIDPQYAGKTLSVSLYDPGDGASGTYYVNILKPGGATVGCSYGIRGATPVAASPCRILTRTSSGTNTYNGKWLDITIAVPTTYTCTTDCWWKVLYEFNGVTRGSSPNDRTVWTATITGDPVHLVNA